jgi:hypothetical protein
MRERHSEHIIMRKYLILHGARGPRLACGQSFIEIEQLV